MPRTELNKKNIDKKDEKTIKRLVEEGKEHIEELKEIDQEISQIKKSTKTFVSFFLPAHDFCCTKYEWYYNWHIKPYATRIHVGILSLVLLLGILIGLPFYFVSPKKTMAADYTCTLNATGNWNDTTKWDNCNGEYPGQTEATVYDVVIPTTLTVTLNANNLNLNNADNSSLGNISVTGTLTTSNNNITFGTMTINSGGVVTAGSSTLTAYGDWSVNTSATFTRGTSTLDLKGSSVSFSPGGNSDSRALYHVNMTSAQTVTLSAQARIYGTLTIGTTSGVTYTTMAGSQIMYLRGTTPLVLNGTYNASGGNGGHNTAAMSIGMNSRANVNLPGSTYATIYIYHGGTANYTTTMTGAVTAAAMSIYSDTSGRASNLNTGGYDLTITNGLGIGTATLNRSATLTASSSTITIGGNLAIENTTAGGTNTLDADSATIKVGGKYANSGNGVLTADTSTIEFTKSSSSQTLDSGGTGAGKSFNNLTHSGAGTLQLITSDIDVNGTFTNSAGTFDADTNDKNMSFAGAWNNTGTATFSRGSGTMTFDGTSTVTNSSSNAATLAAVAISGTATLGSNLTVASTSGAGTLNLGSGSYTLTITGSGTPLAIGTFEKGTGSTTLYTGTSATNITAVSYHSLTLTPASGSVTYSLAGSLTGATAMTGNLTISASATLEVVDGSNYAIDLAGNWTNSGTFTARSGTVTFTATDTGHTINPGSSTFYNLIFNGSGGAWSPLTNTVTVTNDLTVTNGTFDTSSGTANVTVNGQVQCGASCGTINMSSTNTFTQNVAADKNFGPNAGAMDWTFNNLTLTSSTGTPTITVATGNSGKIITKAVMTIGANTTVSAGSKTIELSGTGTPFVKTGTFTAGTSTIKYTGNDSTTVAAVSYHNLEILPSANSKTFTTASGTIACSGNLTMGNGTNTSVMITAQTNNTILDIDGNLTVSANTSFTPGNTAAINIGGNWTINGTYVFTPTTTLNTVTFDGTASGKTIKTNYAGGASQDGKFHNLTINGSGGVWTIVDTDLYTFASGTLAVTDGTLNLAGRTINSGDIDINGGTLTGTTGALYSLGSFNITDAGSSFVAPAIVETYGTTFAIGSGADATNTDWETNSSSLTCYDNDLTLPIDTYYDLSFGSNFPAANFTLGAGSTTVKNDLDLSTLGGAVTLITGDGSNTLNVEGDITIAASTSITSAGSTINLNGNWTNSGDFTPGTGTVAFVGTAIATIAGSTAFNNLIMDTNDDGAKTIKFTAGTTQSIANTWTLDGASGKVLTLRSTSDDTAWKFVILDDMISGDYIDVQDSQNTTNAYRITPGANVTNSGNNDPGWVFNQAPVNDSLTFTNPYTSNIAVADDTTEWTFRALVTDADGPTNIDYIEIHLATVSDASQPYDALKYRWTEATDAFSEVADTDSVGTITSTGTDSSSSGNQWTIDFKIKINNDFLTKDTQYAAELYSIDESAVSDTDNYANIYQVTELAISLAVDDGTLEFGSLLPGSIITGTTTTTVTTNYPNGYSLKAHDGVAASNSALLHTDTSTRIADYAGTIATPTLWSGTGLGICLFAATDKDTDKWGAGTTVDDELNKYAGVPETATTINTKAGSPTSNNQASIGYKIVVPNAQKTGDYSGIVTYTATGNLL